MQLKRFVTVSQSHCQTVCYSQPVALSDGLLQSASHTVKRFVTVSQSHCQTVCYSQPVTLWNGLLQSATHTVKRFVTVSQSHCETVCYSQPVTLWNALLQSASHTVKLRNWSDTVPCNSKARNHLWFSNRTTGNDKNTDPPFKQNFFSVTSPLLDPFATLSGISLKCF